MPSPEQAQETHDTTCTYTASFPKALEAASTGVTVERIVKHVTPADQPAPTEASGEPPTLPTLPELITKPQLQHFQDLGLGRGVNIADPKPWSNRSSYQVREVRIENITASDEGSAYEGYETEVESTFNAHFKMESSFNIPNSPVSVGIDAEQSRNVSTSRKAAGRRVLTRTIAYKAEGEVEDENPLEVRIARWILKQKGETDQTALTTDPKSEEDDEKAAKEQEKRKIDQAARSFLQRMIKDLKSEGEDKMSVKEQHGKDLEAFIKNFRMTHYISAINLGATVYQTYTEKQYQSITKSKTHSTIPLVGKLYT